MMKSKRTPPHTTIRTAVAGALIAASALIPLLSFADTITGTSTGTFSIDGSCVSPDTAQNCTPLFSFSFLPNPSSSVSMSASTTPGAPNTGGPSANAESSSTTSTSTSASPIQTTTSAAGSPQMFTSTVGTSSEALTTATESSSTSSQASSTTSTGSSASTTSSTASTSASSDISSGGGLVSVAQAATNETASSSASSNNGQIFAELSGGAVPENASTPIGTNAFNSTSTDLAQNVSIAVVPSISLSWQTDQPGTSEVRYSTSTLPIDLTSSSTPSLNDDTLVTAHAMTLTGLIPNTPYNIVILSRDVSGTAILSNFFNLDIQTASSTQVATSTQHVSAIPFGANPPAANSSTNSTAVNSL